MKYHVTPDFTEKLGAVRPASLQRLAALVKVIESTDAEHVLEKLSAFGVRSMENDIYVVTAGSARIFFTFGSDNNTKYLLLLDVLEYEPVAVATSVTGRRSPITDTSLNPNINTRLNPYVNSRLNPYVNSRINPYVNSSLNPHVNSLLNPFVNSNLNPFVNSKLNPFVNSQVNPMVNSSINPRVNKYYQGPYLYDLGLKEAGFIVKASDNVILIFDDRNERVGLGVKNAIDGYTLFDAQNNWIGHLVPDEQGGYLRYDKDNQWIGIVV